MIDVQVQDSGRQIPSVWQPGDEIPVCREISVQIPELQNGCPTRRYIVETSVGTGIKPVADYVNALVPGGVIEHLGRREMLSFAQSGLSGMDDFSGFNPLSMSRGVNTSSLFFQAVHSCFADHYPLALRPEVLMQLVLSQIAEAVKQNPERYRDLFTTNGEKENIEIEHNGLVRGSLSPWHEAIELFCPALQEKVPSMLMQDMLAPFSTDTMEAQLARLVTFMDAASPFYEYSVRTLCGIPRVRMLGTAEDWQMLATSVANLSRFFGDTLEKYFRYLIPVTDKLAAQAAGQAHDNTFWVSLYKYKSESGGAKCNGWITAFLNFIFDSEKNVVEKRDNAYDWTTEHKYFMPGIGHGSVPSLVSSVPFVWKYLGTKIDMRFLGGVLGVDLIDGCVTPALSYAVVQSPSVN
ncbi:MAG: hypothetical protein UT30_C0009G0003 [Candidatus Uhrbacteria bacterium GW2011_GWF2_39_13]|uniref:Uncharacterized protein n=1 Tax=Candidatus Uhrbacteria bacterium GW2011_GWF2_39_13 TaxID=1618995 RepID=A0A0G0MME8_9BACT|nr:MAG: hypothetical protein UT30_C0009G0003 [Candidatus Uhrbacteria bacterium GW2011_GWF2_39_13]